MKQLAYVGLILFSFGAARADDWPQWMGPHRDGNLSETGLIEKFPETGAKVLWRVPLAGGYAGPAVVGDRVFVTDYRKSSGNDKPNPSQRSKLVGKERVQCLNARDGKVIWSHEYDCPYLISYACGPRCTPTVHEGKVYTLGAEGNLLCLAADDGKVIWSKDLKKDYNITAPLWGFCGHPLIDGNKLITVAGGEGSVAIALDKNTGKEIWKALSAKEPGYCPPTMIEAGGVRQLLIWHGNSINSLDPENGKSYWSIPLEPNYGMSIMAPRKEGNLLFAGGIGFKSVLIELDKDKPQAKELWRGKKDNSVYPVNSTPYVMNEIMYAVDQPGQLRAVKLATGERLWESFAPTTGGKDRASSGTAFLVRNGDKFFIFAETGHLVIAKLSPSGYQELSRAKILDPTGDAFGREVVWSHPAFANKCCYARNDKEIVCVSLEP